MAVYLYNQSSLALLLYFILYKKRYGLRPSLNHLRTISFIVYYYKKPI